MDKKENVPLILALSIPILMIVMVAMTIYLPALFVKKPVTDFIYAVGGNYYQNKKFVVQNGKIIEKEIQNPYPENSNYRPPEFEIFYYDVAHDTPHELTLEQAQKYTLDGSFRSPDGFEVVGGDGSYDIFFGNRGAYYQKYLKKGVYTRKLNIGNDSYGYRYQNFQLVGWVRP